jgi:hypothetical protein
LDSSIAKKHLNDYGFRREKSLFRYESGGLLKLSLASARLFGDICVARGAVWQANCYKSVRYREKVGE